MIDLGRCISAASESYHAAKVPVPAMGRELKGSTLGVIGYGQIGRYLCDLGLGFGMRVMVADPHAKVEDPSVQKLEVMELLAQSDFVVCLAPATTDTEKSDERAGIRENEAHRLFYQRVARRTGRRTGARRRAGCRSHRRLRAGRWPSPGPDAYAGTGASSEGSGHAARRRTYAAGGGTSGTRARVAQVAEILKGRSPAGAGEYGACIAIGATAA